MKEEILSPDIQEQIIELIKNCIQTATNNNHIAEDELVNDATAAKILGLAKGTLPVWRHEGKGPKYIKMGSAVRYKYRDLLSYIEEHSVRGNN